ncbi:Na/Pi cotransporter family protein [Brumimicrobium aurantiacum]|uniref:Na/Pi cotransporter family protein n=1 Tax=Brumimicrobium aurantiacum TaxID=1737063 RepID=A0A3E1EVE1_9FLAO|nr:Na/Pi cotransporter family protein [Brumimicrobium aurantiacum]RFC53525.1 Na/Pi cotransporter family protein [Brumimicrobium aurantiacum]
MKNKLVLSFAVFFFTFFAFNANAQSDNNVENAPKKSIGTISSKTIENVSSSSAVEGFKVSWNLDYEVFQKLKSEGYKVLIKYNTKIGAKRHEKGYANSDWTELKGIDIHETKYSINNLAGEESYVFKVGVSNGTDTFWSEKKSAKTKRGWGIFKFLVLIGSLGMFIYGMKIMSEGLQQAAGSRLRYLLGSITSNRVKGVLTGFGITSIVQSSSVTTVMTVSFVNAGLMTLVQSAGVMMGANIGTTITGWIINIFGFKVSIGSYALVLIAIGAPLMFFGKQKVKAWSNAIIGFSLLFMGLGFLKDAVPELGPDSWLVQFFVDFKDIPFLSTLLFVLLGTFVTVIVQSSSAAMALTMTLVAGGIIPFEVAAAMILGENIGTTITAELASTIGNVHAKRSARIHSLFNIIGVTWAVLLFPFILDGIEYFMTAIGTGNPFTNPKEHANTGIAIFHTTFNLLNVFVLIWFVPNLVRVAERTVKSKGGQDEEFHLDYIGAGYMSTPDLSMLEAKKEIAKFGELTSRMSGFSRELLFEKSRKNQQKLIDRIAKYEEITDRVEIEVANYLGKISEGELSVDTAVRIRGMNSIVNDLERIGDVFYQISKGLERKAEDKIWFTPQQRERLAELFDLVDEAFVVMIENLNMHSADVSLDAAIAIEEKINAKRDEIRSEYLDALSNDEEVHMKGGIIYNDIFASLEKVGDHIINVSEGIVGKV